MNPTTQLQVLVKDGLMFPLFHQGELLTFDKEVEPGDGDIVYAILNGKPVIRQITYQGSDIYLFTVRPVNPWLRITPEDTFTIAGVIKMSYSLFMSQFQKNQSLVRKVVSLCPSN